MVKLLTKMTFLGLHHNMVALLVELPTSCEVIVVLILWAAHKVGGILLLMIILLGWELISSVFSILPSILTKKHTAVVVRWLHVTWGFQYKLVLCEKVLLVHVLAVISIVYWRRLILGSVGLALLAQLTLIRRLLVVMLRITHLWREKIVYGCRNGCGGSVLASLIVQDWC